jgi:alpha-glucosidase
MIGKSDAGRGVFAVVTVLLGALAPLRAEPPRDLIGWRTARFFPSEEAARQARPSLAFAREPESIGPVPDDFPFEPRWSRRGGTTFIEVQVPASASLYGLGRAPGTLLRNGGRYEGAAVSPWIMGVRDDGTAFGVLLDTTWGAAFEVQPGRITIETGDEAPALVIFDLPDPGEVVLALNDRSGRLEMPPLWALALHMPARAGRGAAALPVPLGDSLWVHAELAKPQGWRGEPAPEIPEGARVSALGELTVDGDLAAKFERGEPAPLWVGAGEQPARAGDAQALDFSDSATRQWWSAQARALGDAGAAGIIIARDPLEALSGDVQVSGDPEMGGPGTLARYSGVWGFLAAKATWEGYEAERHDRRPLLLSPSASIGSQRWTSHMIITGPGGAATPRQAIAGALNSALTAQAVVGAVLPRRGGMSDAEWTAWVSALGMLPIMVLSEAPGEEGARDLLAALAAQRYQLAPYIYTLIFHAFFQGQPVLRPLFLEDGADVGLRGVESAFMLGKDLLVVPNLGDERFQREGTRWADWRQLPVGDQDERLPALYMRPGSAIPLAGPGMSMGEWSLDPLILMASLNEQGEATGVLYEDEWHNYGLFRGQARRLTHRLTTSERTVFVRLGGLDGGWGMPQRRLIVRVLTEQGEVSGEGSERGTIRIALPEGE